MLPIMGSLTKAYDGGYIAFAVIISFANAFDEILHNLLLRRFRSYSVGGPTLEILCSHLTGRTFMEKTGTLFHN